MLAQLHLAPTPRAQANLLAEGVPESAVFVTGNTVIDALHATVAQFNDNEDLRATLDQQFDLDASKRLVLVTLHRRENHGDGLQRICKALARLAMRDDIEIVYPVHPNPNVKGPVEAMLGDLERVKLITPQDYLPFAYLIERAHIILTDSGGVQEEAPALGKPVLVARDNTERPEAVEAGTVRLVGTQEEQVFSELTALLDDEALYQKMSFAHNPYGDGTASAQILEIVRDWGRKHKA